MGDRIKVLVVSTSDSRGGAARAAFRIHDAVRGCGIDSRMFVTDKKTSDDSVLPLSDFIPDNAMFKAFERVRNKIKNKWQQYQWDKYPGRNSYFMSDLRSTNICGALRKIDYDLLHLHWINLRFLPLGALPNDKPIVWTLHDSWPFCGICHLPLDCRGFEKECGCCPALNSEDPNDLSHRIWRRKAKLYNRLDLHIVAPSRWMADRVQKSSLLGGFDIRVIPNCIDVELYSPGEKINACKFLHLDSEKEYILFGAMNAVQDDNKGFRFLIDALGRISSSFHQGVELVVFGSNAPFDNRIAEIQVVDMGIVKNSEKLVSLYRAASVVVVPSLSENLSCTIMESLSCGTPVVAFDIGGNGDMVDHKKNGYLAREKDSCDLADGIRWCLENNKDRHLSENARRTVLENYTPEKVGRQYASLYQSLMTV